MAHRRYQDVGINWTWYVEGEFNDTDMTVVISDVYRIHKGEDKTPNEPEGTTVTNSERTVTHVEVGRRYNSNNVVYRVLNPKNLYLYGK